MMILNNKSISCYPYAPRHSDYDFHEERLSQLTLEAFKSVRDTQSYYHFQSDTLERCLGVGRG
jgi:hypothetical protein